MNSGAPKKDSLFSNKATKLLLPLEALVNVEENAGNGATLSSHRLCFATEAPERKIMFFSLVTYLKLFYAFPITIQKF